MIRTRRLLAPTVLGGGGIIILAAAWTGLSLASDPAHFPSIPLIGTAIADNFVESRALAYKSYGEGGIWTNLLYTIWNVYLGVAIGIAIGFVSGLLLARVTWVGRLARFPVAILGTVPVIVILPFLGIWFGTSPLATQGLVIFYTALTVTGAVESSSRAAAVRYADYAATLGIGPSRTTFSVLLPATVPQAVGVIRAAAGFGWGFECIAELLGGKQGAGVLIQTFANSTATASVIGVLLFVGAAAVITDALIAWAGHWAVRWNE